MDKNLQSTNIFEIADAFQTSSILFLANKEGLFDILETPSTVESVANKKKWLDWKTKILLNSLVALNLLRKEDIYYQNTEASSKFLVRSKTTYQGDIVEHERLQWNLWNSLDKIMITKEATVEQQDIRFIQENHDNNVFHDAMKQLADELTQHIIKIKGWHQKKKIIDLAGGHGLYVAELIKSYPNLNGEIWDLSSAKTSATNLINEFGLADKLIFLEKDITNELSYVNQKCDGILVNHCLHHFHPKQVYEILKLCYNMLDANGTIAMIESQLNIDLVTPKSNALFSMYMMVNRQHGQVHSTNWIVRKLVELGFKVETKNICNPSEDTLIVARKI